MREGKSPKPEKEFYFASLKEADIAPQMFSLQATYLVSAVDDCARILSVVLIVWNTVT